MGTGARLGLQTASQNQKKGRSNGIHRAGGGLEESAAHVDRTPRNGLRPRVFVAAENRLLLEALARALAKREDIDVVGSDAAGPLHTDTLLKEEVDILLLASLGNRSEDLVAIRRIRTMAPNVRILLIGVTGEEMEFLQCVRAGVAGYLPRDAATEDVVAGVRAIQAGEAVCPGELCATLFRYFEREANSFPSARMHRGLGLTRREQQFIPLIAEGLTNKEIANRFCLSEQTVKNHLYRMKHKVGAEDRLDIVQVCRTQGFMF